MPPPFVALFIHTSCRKKEVSLREKRALSYVPLWEFNTKYIDSNVKQHFGFLVLCDRYRVCQRFGQVLLGKNWLMWFGFRIEPILTTLTASHFDKKRSKVRLKNDPLAPLV